MNTSLAQLSHLLMKNKDDFNLNVVTIHHIGGSNAISEQHQLKLDYISICNNPPEESLVPEVVSSLNDASKVTMCGFQNPTCAPQNVNVIQEAGRWFQFNWQPGCYSEDNSLFVEAYQLERDGTTDIGGDFKKSDTQSTNSVDTCTHVIDAGSQLVDSSDAMLRDWGKNHTWCVRSLVKEEGRGEPLSSYWSCDNVVVEWMTSFGKLYRLAKMKT